MGKCTVVFVYRIRINVIISLLNYVIKLYVCDILAAGMELDSKGGGELMGLVKI